MNPTSEVIEMVLKNPRYIDLLKRLLAIVRHLVKLAINRSFDYLAFSDHDMTAVRDYIDL